ncbi:hypothetical protein BpOF4_21229 (plasmid) [Alkalihalophilus pseudofirmus OF4]|uniref:Uncharacterized protein n=1 Tax=Alkalihalophilus pseudofirmus (strain ATCC BAA-2126 / JCM 17055 / OF4) TaxID=398511 RepID=D3G1L5_ALKPO|nr:hypothetical protein BpOF4_21229 [Alkalihalophilus pseudofirmus OF4]
MGEIFGDDVLAKAISGWLNHHMTSINNGGKGRY